MSEIRSQAAPARDETKREMLTRLGMIHLPERYGTRLRLEPSHDNEIRVDITHSGGTESHFPDALDLLESVEAVVEHMGLRKPRTVNSAAEFDALNPNAVCSFVDSNGITYACTAGEWQMGGFFLTIKPFPMITVHTHAEST